MDLPGHTDEVYCVDFVADKIASGGRDKKVKMYVDNVSNLKRFVSLTVRNLHPSTAGDIRYCVLDIAYSPSCTHSIIRNYRIRIRSLTCSHLDSREESVLLKGY